MKVLSFICLSLPTLFVSFTLSAATTTFFDSEEVVSMRLEAPISTLKKQRGDDPEWLVGKVFYETTDGVEAMLNVQIKARGNFRRIRRTCNFPPYWLNFKKSEVKGTPFAGLDKIC